MHDVCAKNLHAEWQIIKLIFFK